jgi:dienelactone hydrolase
MARLALAALLAVALQAASAAARAASDVWRSWAAAAVQLPGEARLTTPDRVPAERRRPVVVYLHGCVGLDPETDPGWMAYVAGLGFIVVAPDRFARGDRRPSCFPPVHPAIYEMRLEELRYALEQLRASPWADLGNLFLMGHSEGGVVAALSPFDDFRGVIISGWTCTSPFKDVNGLAVPAQIPILSIAWQHDTVFFRHRRGTAGSCADRLAGRAGSRQVTLPGPGHAVYQHPATREAVAAFLRGNLTGAASPGSGPAP